MWNTPDPTRPVWPAVVGTLTLTEGKVIRETYECAAWFRDYQVDAGSYDVIAYEPNPHTLYVRYRGAVCISAYLKALWAGTPIPGPDHASEAAVGQVGNPSDSFSTYRGQEALEREGIVFNDKAIWTPLTYQDRDGKDQTCGKLEVTPGTLADMTLAVKEDGRHSARTVNFNGVDEIRVRVQTERSGFRHSSQCMVPTYWEHPHRFDSLEAGREFLAAVKAHGTIRPGLWYADSRQY